MRSESEARAGGGAERRLRGLYLLDPDVFPGVYGPEQQAEIAALIDVQAEPLGADAVRRQPEVLAPAEVIMSGWGAPPLDEALLRSAPRLRAVFYSGGSLRPLMTEAAWARGLTVSSAASANAVPVAEYTLATILLSLKRFWQLSAAAKRGVYALRPDAPGAYRSTVGLVSLGAVGRLVRERLRPVEVRVVAYDPFVTAAEAQRLDLELVSLTELFSVADVVSLHTPSLPETRRLVGAPHLKAMKRGATLINTSRGDVIDESALTAVWQSRPDLFAVLDVTDPEPPEPDSPLFGLPNVLLTPHIAGSQGGELRRLGALTVGELRRYVRGEPLRWAVGHAQAQRLA